MQVPSLRALATSLPAVATVRSIHEMLTYDMRAEAPEERAALKSALPFCAYGGTFKC
jgi:hypothetical protein